MHRAVVVWGMAVVGSCHPAERRAVSADPVMRTPVAARAQMAGVAWLSRAAVPTLPARVVYPWPSPIRRAAGRLDPAQIQTVVRKNFGRFRICYEAPLRG